MGIVDFWSLITGVAGLLSFLLAAWDKFPAWRKYLVPTGVFLGGFAIGRLSPFIGAGIEIFGKIPQTAGSITIVFILAMIALVYLIFMLKKGQPGLAYIGLIFMFTMAAPAVLKSYGDIAFKISPSEYLMLSSAYEQKQDYDNSIRCLENYIAAQKDPDEKKLLEKKMVQLKSMRIFGIGDEKKGNGRNP